jgi:hypothetical protein
VVMMAVMNAIMNDSAYALDSADDDAHDNG